MNFLSWNCRGITSTSKRKFIRQSIVQYSIDFCMIQETKKEDIDSFLINSLWDSKGLR